MTSRELLYQMVTRYQRARRLVLDAHPHGSELEFRALVRETVQRLAEQEKDRENNDLKQPTVAHNLRQAAEALRQSDDWAAVKYIERAKQLLEEQESHHPDLALTAKGTPQEIRSLLEIITRFQWLLTLEVRHKVIRRDAH